MLLGVGGYYRGGFGAAKSLPPCGPKPLVRIKGGGGSCCIPAKQAWKGKQICCGPKKIAKTHRQAGGKFSMSCKPWQHADPGGPGDVEEDPRTNGGGNGGVGSIFEEGGDLFSGGVPTWAWIAGAGIIAFTLLKKKKGGNGAKT